MSVTPFQEQGPVCTNFTFNQLSGLHFNERKEIEIESSLKFIQYGWIKNTENPN